MVDLSVLVTTLLPARDPRIRHVLVALCERRGRFQSADATAGAAGFRTRHQLHRALAAAGLPPVTTLAQWIRALGWMLDADTGNRSMSALALSEEEDPAVRYRLVQRLTGASWSTVSAAGLGWLVHRFLDRVYGSAAAAAHAQDDPKEGRKEGKESGRLAANRPPVTTTDAA